MPKKRDTKTEILKVSAKLFTEKGYDKTSTRDIARAISIASPSLYYHFKSKGDILMELLKEPMAYIASELEMATTLPQKERVGRIVEALITTFEFHNGIVITASNHSEDISESQKSLIGGFEAQAFNELAKGIRSTHKELRITMVIGAIERVVMDLNSKNQSNFTESFRTIKKELIEIALKILSG